MNSDLDSQSFMPNEELASERASELLSRERAALSAVATLERLLEQCIATLRLAKREVTIAANGPYTQKLMPSLLRPKLDSLQRELQYIQLTLPVKDAVNLSSMLASDESYSAPYTGPGSAKPFSGKLESK